MDRPRIGVRQPTLGPLLSYDRYCAEILAQTDQLRSHIEDADLAVPVPSCPGWNVGQLLRHLGGAQRWAEATVRTRATQPLPDEHCLAQRHFPVRVRRIPAGGRRRTRWLLDRAAAAKLPREFTPPPA